MPPSPALRFSPGRELRADNHKRGRSLEGGIISRERDEDLALFNELQNRETDNFLLQSNDDFEDSFSTKLRYFSDYKLGISVPARGESSDLLNADGDKNDYDWLITPPDTPLFRSLDDDPTPVNLVQRGRTRTQPISISRSSTMEKNHRSSRGSASPNRLSPSPRSGNSTFQSQGRTSPAPSSSPTPILRQSTPTRRPSSPSTKSSTHTTPTPTRRPSSPSSKSSTPGPHALTPTPRRLSTSSTMTRGTSPVNTSRGSSTSPKVRAWQSNIPGFSLEVPPNLRTSLADRPASYVRGSSPASRNGNSRRQSMSPTASRSVSSSHSQDRDRFSSHSKGSIASSGDDDLESLPSVIVGSSASRRVGGGFPNSRVSPVSKKPSRTVPSSSAPKRSYELALRQMDQRKSPPNRFRPLLSSVPSSTFHTGKTSAAHRVLISRNSSVTTSSNASSDLVTSGVHDNEASDQNHEDLMCENQDDVTSKYVKESDHDIEEDLFMFDRADTSNENLGNKLDGVLKHAFGDRNTAMKISATSDYLDSDGHMDPLLCPNCGCRYSADQMMEEDPLKLCLKCQKLHLPLTMSVPAPLTPTVVSENSTSVSIVKENESFDESQEVTSTSGSKSGQQEGQHCYNEPIWNFLPEEDEHRLASQQVTGHSPSVSSTMPDSDVISEKMQYSGDFPNLKISSDGGDGAGISILLKKSSSSIGTVVQSRNFSASSISFDDLSYVRGSTNSMRSSVGHGTSVSASSSVDLGRFQRQQSNRKSDVENYRFDPFAKHQRSVSSLSGNSSQAFQPSSLGTSTQDLGKDTADMSSVPSQEQLITSEFTEIDDSCTDVVKNHVSALLVGNSAALFSNLEESASHENVEESKNNILEGETLTTASTTVDIAEIPSQSSLNAISEIEIENTSQHSAGSRYGSLSSSPRSSIDELIEPPILAISDDVAVQPNAESTLLVRSEGGTTRRSLTLEEATDTILFCRSIVHHLAYDAANIAINKETPSPSEASWELIPTTGKSDTNKSDPRSKNVGKRSSKSQKTRQKKVESESKSKPPIGLTKLDQKSDSPTTTRLVGVPNNGESTRPPKLESKCNCTIM